MADAVTVEILTAAVDDLEAAVDWYLAEAGPDVAGRFLAAVEDLLRRLRRFPDSGSATWATLLQIDGLRSTPMAGCPYVAFHVRRDERVQLVQVLHERRDLPTQLVGPQ